MFSCRKKRDSIPRFSGSHMHPKVGVLAYYWQSVRALVNDHKSLICFARNINALCVSVIYTLNVFVSHST